MLLVRDVDERLPRHEPKLQLREHAERPERAVDHLEEMRGLAVRPAAEDLAVGRDDLVFEARVVEAAVAKRHRLERAARHRATDRDRLQLRNDERHETVLHGRSDEIAEGNASFRRARAARHVDLENLIEIGDVDLRVGAPLVAELRDLMGDGLLLQRERRRRIMSGELPRDALDLHPMGIILATLATTRPARSLLTND